MMPERTLHSEPLKCVFATYYVIWRHQVVPALLQVRWATL